MRSIGCGSGTVVCEQRGGRRGNEAARRLKPGG
jgi:hypothetical protein